MSLGAMLAAEIEAGRTVTFSPGPGHRELKVTVAAHSPAGRVHSAHEVVAGSHPEPLLSVGLAMAARRVQQSEGGF